MGFVIGYNISDEPWYTYLNKHNISQQLIWWILSNTFFCQTLSKEQDMFYLEASHERVGSNNWIIRPYSASIVIWSLLTESTQTKNELESNTGRHNTSRIMGTLRIDSQLLLVSRTFSCFGSLLATNNWCKEAKHFTKTRFLSFQLQWNMLRRYPCCLALNGEEECWKHRSDSWIDWHKSRY